MNKTLDKLLQKDYQDDIEWQIHNASQAEQARQAGELAKYFDFSLHLRFPDTCWALERWEEAHKWYNHNAQILMEGRAWHSENSGSEYPLNALIKQEATTLIKAGNLERGRSHLENAISYWENQPEPELELTELGLHAAQAGLSSLADYALSIIKARQLLPGGRSRAAKRARELLHYEPAQIALLLGRWEEFERRLRELKESEKLVTGNLELAFPVLMQSGLLAAAKGMEILADMRTGRKDLITGKAEAIAHFEEAMLKFYQFSGRSDWNTYFMRLNTCLVEDLAAGRPINVNPFADKTIE